MNKFHYYLLTIIYMFFIAYMSLIPLHAPGEKVSLLKQVFDNFLHVPGYGLLAFLWIKLLCVGEDLVSSRLIYAALITIAYGILMEYLQSLTAYRSASFMDVCSNALGTGIVVVAVILSPKGEGSQVL